MNEDILRGFRDVSNVKKFPFKKITSTGNLGQNLAQKNAAITYNEINETTKAKLEQKDNTLSKSKFNFKAFKQNCNLNTVISNVNEQCTLLTNKQIESLVNNTENTVKPPPKCPSKKITSTGNLGQNLAHKNTAITNNEINETTKTKSVQKDNTLSKTKFNFKSFKQNRNLNTVTSNVSEQSTLLINKQIEPLVNNTVKPPPKCPSEKITSTGNLGQNLAHKNTAITNNEINETTKTKSVQKDNTLSKSKFNFKAFKQNHNLNTVFSNVKEQSALLINKQIEPLVNNTENTVKPPKIKHNLLSLKKTVDEEIALQQSSSQSRVKSLTLKTKFDFKRFKQSPLTDHDRNYGSPVKIIEKTPVKILPFDVCNTSTSHSLREESVTEPKNTSTDDILKCLENDDDVFICNESVTKKNTPPDDILKSLEDDEDIFLHDSLSDKSVVQTKNTSTNDILKCLEDDDDLFMQDFFDNVENDLNLNGGDEKNQFKVFVPDCDDRNDDSKEFRGIYPHTEVMKEMLHEKFGLKQFRPHQEEIINASLMQHDCFVLMPTGGGKSLCYQLPAVLMPGVTIVISPLRALISDQVDKLNALDIPSAHLCSDVSKSTTDLILSKLHVREPEIKLLYLTPEKIVASKNVTGVIKSLYQRGKLALFVIDEVHCLSQWGHDFRPDYKQLSCLKSLYPKVPIMCLTATATKLVQQDVLQILKIKNVKTFIRSFNRPNIKYTVIPKLRKTVVSDIANLIRSKFNRMSGIIYCLSRDDCDKLAVELCRMGIKARSYHAGMSDKIREKHQRDWMNDNFYVIVATIAFGMGIDKPNVRFVIHNSVPKTVEAFYQESGRAGRDGELSYSYIFYCLSDVVRLQKLLQLKTSNKKTLQGHLDNLQKMVMFCENKVDCRRYLQLIHLGEKFDKKLCTANPLTMCDNCENKTNYIIKDMTKESKELVQIVEDIHKDGVTMLHVAEIYKGAKLHKIVDKGHDKHKYFGHGKHMNKSDIHRILKQLTFKQILSDDYKCTGAFPIVYIKPGPKLNNIHSNDEKFELTIEKHPTKPITHRESTVQIPSPQPSTSSSPSYLTASLKVQCHEELLEECRKFALERNVTLSSIMNLSAIKIMSELLPGCKEEFMKIQHVTQANYDKFGENFLRITKKYKEKIDAHKPTVQTTLPDDDFYEYCTQTNKKRGTKRKRSNKTKKGGRKNKRTKRSPKTKKSPKKKQVTPKKKSSSLGLMNPVPKRNIMTNNQF